MLVKSAVISKRDGFPSEMLSLGREQESKRRGAFPYIRKPEHKTRIVRWAPWGSKVEQVTHEISWVRIGLLGFSLMRRETQMK